MRDCIDAGTEFCPCHLAAANECIICSQLSGKSFCDCINWKGTCILQEYSSNGNDPKAQRKSYNAQIVDRIMAEEEVLKLKIKIPRKLAQDLSYPGSYIFIRKPNTMQFYDTPISIMHVDLDENIITVAIEIRGIKTKNILALGKGEKILVRGPFWNGIFGLKNIYALKNSKAIIAARGIGAAPMVPVIDKLIANNNQVVLLLDKTPFSTFISEEYIKKYNIEICDIEMLEKGELTEGFINYVEDLIKNEEFKLLHCSAADILSYKITKKFQDSIKLSCCNNAKMCCGEGVCGSCSSRYSGHIVKRLCKVQCEPSNLFEGRRLI